MGKKSGPPAPDYTAAAEKTADSSKEVTNMQTWANRADQSNPWGSTQWTTQSVKDPATGQMVTKWKENTTLDPRLQSALDSQIALQGGRSDLANSLLPRAQQEFGQAMNWDNAVGWANLPQAQGLRPTTSAYGFGGGMPSLENRMGYGQGNVQRGLNFGGVQGVDDAAATRSRAENAIYQSAASRLDPQWQSRQDSLESDLANRGISMNSEAYSRAKADFDRSRNDAYAQAQMAAITGGGEEAQRDFGMDLGLRQQQVGEIGQQGQFANSAQNQAFGQSLQGGQARNAANQSQFEMLQNLRQLQLGQQQQAFGQQQAAGTQNFNQQLQLAQFQNQTRQNQLAEEMQRRGFSLNEINAIISGQQVGMPTFQGYNQAQASQAVDYSGAAQQQYSAAMDAQNAKNAATGQAISGIASAAMMFSDRRVKADILRIGTHPRGFGIYSYRYIGERGLRVGVIAQEVARRAPELVRSLRGVWQVDYAGL
jgi:hypothetical protein